MRYWSPTRARAGPGGDDELAAAQVGRAAQKKLSGAPRCASAPNVRGRASAARAPRISEWRGERVVAERPAAHPLLVAARVDLVGRHAHREHPADEGAHADAGDAVDPDAGAKELLDDADVGQGPRAAAREHHADRMAGQAPGMRSTPRSAAARGGRASRRVESLGPARRARRTRATAPRRGRSRAARPARNAAGGSPPQRRRARGRPAGGRSRSTGPRSPSGPATRGRLVVAASARSSSGAVRRASAGPRAASTTVPSIASTRRHDGQRVGESAAASSATGPALRAAPARASTGAGAATRLAPGGLSELIAERCGQRQRDPGAS